MNLLRKIWARDTAHLVRQRFSAHTIVFTNGCFDLLHPGHISYLAAAKCKGDILVIGLNSDDSVKRLKGDTRPINTIQDRAVMLAALEVVDVVIVFEEDTPLRLIEDVSPDVLIKGGDYNVADIVGADHVLERGGIVDVIPFLEGYSSSNIIGKIKNQT